MRKVTFPVVDGLLLLSVFVVHMFSMPFSQLFPMNSNMLMFEDSDQRISFPKTDNEPQGGSRVLSDQVPNMGPYLF